MLAVCLYAVAGGFIFQHLESTNEMEECRQGEAKYLPMENETVYKMWSISSSFRSLDDKPVGLYICAFSSFCSFNCLFIIVVIIIIRSSSRHPMSLRIKLDVCIALNEHNTVFASKRSAICNRYFPGPIRVLDANSISIASAIFAGLTR